MASTQVASVIDALVTLATTAVGTSADVYDGPQVTDAYSKAYVGIGWEANEDDDGSGTAASVEQEWGPLGNFRKDEDATVYCVVSVWSGDTNAKGRRDQAMTILALVEAALRANPGLGISNLRNAKLATGDLIQRQTGEGVRADFIFTVTYQARI